MSARKPSDCELGRIIAALLGEWLLFGIAIACLALDWRTAGTAVGAVAIAVGAYGVYAMGPVLRWVFAQRRVGSEGDGETP